MRSSSQNRQARTADGRCQESGGACVCASFCFTCFFRSLLGARHAPSFPRNDCDVPNLVLHVHYPSCRIERGFRELKCLTSRIDFSPGIQYRLFADTLKDPIHSRHQRRWDREAKRVDGLAIDCHLNFIDAFDWDFFGSCPAQNFRH